MIYYWIKIKYSLQWLNEEVPKSIPQIYLSTTAIEIFIFFIPINNYKTLDRIILHGKIFIFFIVTFSVNPFNPIIREITWVAFKEASMAYMGNSTIRATGNEINLLH